MEKSSGDDTSSSALSAWETSQIRSTECAKAGEHGRFTPPYTGIVSSHTVAGLAFTQLKKVYVLHIPSQSGVDELGSYLTVPELVVKVLLPY